MRYPPGHKQEARARLIAAAGRGFRKHGFGGVGIDGLASEAQVTSGAFYGHFPSKEAAFREALAAGLEDLRNGVKTCREQAGPGWLEPFVDFYLGHRRLCDLGESCALQSLTPEVERADPLTRTTYQTALLAIVDAITEGFEGGAIAAETCQSRARAWALLAMLSGGVGMARAVQDPEVSAAIARSVRESALRAAWIGAET